MLAKQDISETYSCFCFPPTPIKEHVVLMHNSDFAGILFCHPFVNFSSSIVLSLIINWLIKFFKLIMVYHEIDLK